jgi:hypothetical protein
MHTLSVILVEPFSPGDESASVTLKSGCDEIVAFCWPCSLSVGDVIENRLSTMEGDTVASYLSDWPEEEKNALSSERLERTGHFSYRGRGRVIDQSEGLVEVNGFVIEFDEVLCDGFVDFEIARLDVKPSRQSSLSVDF